MPPLLDDLRPHVTGRLAGAEERIRERGAGRGGCLIVPGRVRVRSEPEFRRACGGVEIAERNVRYHVERALEMVKSMVFGLADS